MKRTYEVNDHVEIGGTYRFAYPVEFITLPDYSAHRGEPVRVVREANETESDHHSDPDLLTMYFIEAADGWTGLADSCELESMS